MCYVLRLSCYYCCWYCYSFYDYHYDDYYGYYYTSSSSVNYYQQRATRSKTAWKKQQKDRAAQQQTRQGNKWHHWVSQQIRNTGTNRVINNRSKSWVEDETHSCGFPPIPGVALRIIFGIPGVALRMPQNFDSESCSETGLFTPRTPFLTLSHFQASENWPMPILSILAKFLLWKTQEALTLPRNRTQNQGPSWSQETACCRPGFSTELLRRISIWEEEKKHMKKEFWGRFVTIEVGTLTPLPPSKARLYVDHSCEAGQSANGTL